MRKLLLISFLFLCVSISGFSQANYKGGIGISLGSPSGLNGKYFVSDKAAIEGIVGWSLNKWSNSIGLTALYQIHNVAFDVPELLWYYGIGGHVGVASWDEDGDPRTDEGSTAWIGLDLVIGIEYTIPNAPINFSLEAVPGINLLPDTSPGIGANLGIRYVFK